jgi:hypothetical protein
MDGEELLRLGVWRVERMAMREDPAMVALWNFVQEALHLDRRFGTGFRPQRLIEAQPAMQMGTADEKREP